MELPILMKRILYSRLLLAVSIVIFLAVFFQLIQVVSRGSATDKEIDGLEKQVEELNTEQKRLEHIKSFLQTDFFVEREARTKFGMQKKGEHAVIITGKEQGEPPSSAATDAVVYTKKSASPHDKTSNPRDDETNNHLWFRYFFGNQ